MPGLSGLSPASAGAPARTPVAAPDAPSVTGSDGLSAFVRQIRTGQIRGEDGTCATAHDPAGLRRIFAIQAPPQTGARPLDIPSIRKDFPGAEPKGARPAAGLAGQRRHDAEATKRDRRRVAFLRDGQLEHPPRGAYAGCAGYGCLRARPPEGADLPGRRVEQGHRLRARHHRGNQLRRPDLRPQVPAARRRNSPVHPGAPRQHRAVADDRQGEGRRDPGNPGERPGRSDAGGLRGAAGSPDQAGGPYAGLEQHRHGPAGGRHDPRGQALQCARADRRRAIGLAFPRERAGHRVRLLCVLGPQDFRADGDRGRLRPRAAPRNPAAVARRRQHDQERHLRGDDLQRSAGEIRGGHPERGRRGRSRFILGF